MAQTLFTLTPAEAKRLIAKAVAVLPVVQNAFVGAKLAIAHGSTNAFVVEELLGEEIANKGHFCSGVITAGRPCAANPRHAMKPYLFANGERVDAKLKEFLTTLTGGDVLIKGANAVDAEGNVGILLGSRDGGTIGAAWPTMRAVGATLVVPIGLEKLIPSVVAVPATVAIDNYDYTLGMPVGIMPITGATVVTEIEALAILGKVEATLIAAGGTAGSEGSTTFVVTGESEKVAKVFQLITDIKGEPPVARSRQNCKNCDIGCEYFKMDS
ncbi:MAG: hypothetical protein NUK65_04340 [Firmicutes bacterium]|nr:hypothetical protein [Bacillota bacterium]